MARAEAEDDVSLLKDPFFARKISELEIDLLALEFTELRTLAAEHAGKGPGPESSLLKIKGTEIQQRLTELALEASGHLRPGLFPRLRRGGLQRHGDRP